MPSSNIRSNTGVYYISHQVYCRGHAVLQEPHLGVLHLPSSEVDEAIARSVLSRSWVYLSKSCWPGSFWSFWVILGHFASSGFKVWLRSCILFSMLANHQIKHPVTSKVGCQPGDCRYGHFIFLRGLWLCIRYVLTYSLYHPWGCWSNGYCLYKLTW